MRGAVVVELGAGDERALKMLEDEGVQDVRVGVQLGLQCAKGRIDGGMDDAGNLDRLGEAMPHAAILGDVEAGDFGLARRPRESPAVGKLPAAARMKRALLQNDGAGTRIEHTRLEREDVGMVVTEVARHGRRAA